ncbi:hypothetical protein ACFWP2_20530 [Kitasatospora sp. NPDC058444]|uniref:hypothetical protein n=1 Tax=Kitasatospora sp. NPDC058444 TaxID=3346504 RepID=UPI0036659369
MHQRSNTGPTAAETALDAAVPDDVPALPAEALLAVHHLDLDTLVPAARRWRSATRAHAARLLRQAAPMLRHLVAEVVTMDRLAYATDDKLSAARAEAEQLRAELEQTRAVAVPDESPLVVAHGLALRLSQQLSPSPVSVSVDRYPYDDTPRVTVHADAAGAIEAWGVELGAEIQWRDYATGNSRMGRGECSVDGVPVSLTAAVYLGRTAVAS